jgi:predicted nucleic acid-binding protein
MKWLLDEELFEHARRLLRTAVESSELLTAPPLLPSEVTNGVRQQVRRGFVGPQEAPSLLARFFAVPIELQTPEHLYERALALAIELGLPATYDAQYLVVSQSLGATFWTADERLFNATASRLPFVHLLRDYPN